MRWGTILIFAASGLVLLACDAQRTRIRLDVPASARGRITSVWVGAFEANGTVCTDLAFWATGSCGRACSDVPPPLTMSAATRSASLTPGDDGTFGAPELDVSGATRWQVVVVAQVEGEEPLYGCRSVEAGTEAVLPLFWPWCSARACDRLFHPACRAEIECTPEPLLDPLTPSCRVDVDSITVWEEDGRSCAAPASPAGLCREALFRCVAGALEPEVAGICPRSAVDEMCVANESTYMPAMDIDCDGAHPLCAAMTCDPMLGGRRACGDRACLGVSVCVDGRFGECIYGDAEACNGVDDDCDDSTDEGDGPLADCNMGRRPRTPVASACRGGTCACGSGLACRGDNAACCDGACVDVTSSVLHCGACNEPCGRGVRCALGTCATDRADAGVTDPDAGEPGCGDVATCNLTHQASDACIDGTCLCGRDRPCALPELCCAGRCVDVRSSAEHCGRCGRACDACVRGRCR